MTAAMSKQPAALEPSTRSWQQRLGDQVGAIKRRVARDEHYARANVNAVKQCLSGLGPDDSNARATAGARLVVNVSSANVPRICREGYMNEYELKGETEVTQRRKDVDAAIEGLTRLKGSQTYFAAVSLNGTGIRFFGDVCLVLKPDCIDPEAWVLDRNSFDLLRPPVAEDSVESTAQSRLARHVKWLQSWAGQWGKNLAQMVAVRALQQLDVHGRRWTTGQIARVVMDDEDYIEVLHPRQIRIEHDVQEARLTAADAVQDYRVADQVGRVPAPRLEQQIWRLQRRRAEIALREAGVPVSVAVQEGRLRG